MESPPIANQGTGSDIETVQSSIGTPSQNDAGRDQESTQQTASYIKVQLVEEKCSASSETQRRTNSKSITLVAYTDNNIVPSQSTTSVYRGDINTHQPTDSDQVAAGHNTQRNAETHLLAQVKYDIVQPNAQPAIVTHTTAAGGCTASSTPALLQPTTQMQCQTILESPPIADTRLTVTNQGADSDIETVQSSSNQNNHVGSNQESSQPSASQSRPRVRVVTVNADVLDQVVKLAAFYCRTLQPHGETAEQHENNFHRLLTSIEEFQREPIVTTSGAASNLPMQTRSQLNQQSSALTPPTTRASGMEQSISLTSKNGLSACKESSFDSTLTEETLEDSFNDECETPVPSQSAPWQSRNPFRRESDEILECGEPPRKRVKMTSVNLDEDRRAQSSRYQQGRVSNEAMYATVTVVDDQQESLLPTAAQSSRK